MSTQRRMFLKKSTLFAGAALIGKPLDVIADVSKKVNTLHTSNALTIFQSNDLHSYLGDGLFDRTGLQAIKKILKQQEAGLIVDAGDFICKDKTTDEHEKAIQLMNQIGYHAATIGNNELAMGQDHLAGLLGLMRFDLVNCNYEFSHPTLAKQVKSHVVIHINDLKVGITGVGINPRTEGVGYHDPYQSANRVAAYLKKKAGCNFVICLSHLGLGNGKISSRGLAEQSAHIDMVVSGHETKVMTSAAIVHNANKEEVILSQAGKNGTILGKSSFSFDENKEKRSFDHNYLMTGFVAEDTALAYRKLVEMKTKMG